MRHVILPPEGLHGNSESEAVQIAPVEAGVVFLKFVLDAFAGDHQQVVGRDADLDVLLAQPGSIHLEDVGVLGFADVHLRVRSRALMGLGTSCIAGHSRHQVLHACSE